MNKLNQTQKADGNKTIKRFLTICKQWLAGNRILLIRLILLVISTVLGVYLALWWFAENVLPSWLIILDITSFKESIGITKSTWLDSSLTTLLLVFPTLLFLWIFRTHDTREQIKTTQNNTLTSFFTHALDMITSNDRNRRFTGLIQLAQLKRQTKDFDAQIDVTTRNLNLSIDISEGDSLSSEPPVEHQLPPLMASFLKNMDLSGANFSGANLSGANFSGANLCDANLSDAYLSDANLSDANLSDADLSHAYLSDANLSGALFIGANLSYAFLIDAKLNDAILIGANLSDAKNLALAKYNDKTQFPEGFNPEAREMFKVDDIGLDEKQSED